VRKLIQGSKLMESRHNRSFDADAQVLRRFAARLLRAGQLQRYASHEWLWVCSDHEPTLGMPVKGMLISNGALV
jgi:hypothetical protein